MDLLNLKDATKGLEISLGKVVDGHIGPLVDKSIKKISAELSVVVLQAGERIDRNIELLSQEIHNQRTMTKDDIKQLISYATAQLGDALDQRIREAKHEASTLINEKVELFKSELEVAAVNSRKVMYTNVAISISLAIGMAAVSLISQRISLGELSPLGVFRASLLSCSTFFFFLSGLKAFHRWRGMKPLKKGMATLALGHLGILRPNGAGWLFLLSAFLLSGWIGLTFYWH